MSEYPDIATGTRFDQTSAAAWRRLCDDVSILKRTVFGGTNSQQSASGARFSPVNDPGFHRWFDKTVVIVRKPVEGDKTLLVREARYANLPPKPCTGDGDNAACFYEWIGSAFEVYPPLGVKPIAYEGDENTTAITTPPKLTTKFHRIHREYDAWIIEAPPAGGMQVKSVRLISIIGNPTTSERLQVQVVEENDAGAIVDVGEQTDHGVWFNFFGRHYSQFLNRTPAIILPSIYLDGDWRVMPLHRFRSASPSSAVGTDFCPT